MNAGYEQISQGNLTLFQQLRVWTSQQVLLEEYLKMVAVSELRLLSTNMDYIQLCSQLYVVSLLGEGNKYTNL